MVRTPKMPKEKSTKEEKTKEVWDKVFEIEYCTALWYEAKTKKVCGGKDGLSFKPLRTKRYCKRNKTGVCCKHCRFKEKCNKVCSQASKPECSERFPGSELEKVYDDMTTLNPRFYRRMCNTLKQRKKGDLELW